jgi:hypothetical protein
MAPITNIKSLISWPNKKPVRSFGNYLDSKWCLALIQDLKQKNLEKHTYVWTFQQTPG